MSKKLLTGVLALSILLLGNTAVFSGLPDGGHLVQPLPTSNPSAPLFGQDDARPLKFEKLQKLEATEYVDLTGATLTKSFVPTFTCEDRDNTCYPCGWAGVSFRNSGALGGDVTSIGNRYGVETRFLCSLSGTWIYLGGIDGDIDGEFGVWTGAGGVPNTQVASVVVNSTALTPGDWNYIDLSALNLTFFQEDFYVTFGTVLGSAVDAGGPETDRIQSVVDNAGGAATEPRRGVTFDATVPGWTTNDLFWSQYYNLVGSAIMCCEEQPYTNCFLDSYMDSYSFIYSFPSTFNCRKGIAMRFSTGGFDTLLVAEYSLSDYFSGTDPDGEVILEMLADDGAGVPDASSSLAPSLTVGGVGLGADLYPLGSFGWLDFPLNLVPGPGVDYHLAVRWTGPDPAVTGFGSGFFADDDGLGETHPEHVASVYFPNNTTDLEWATCPSPVGFEGWNNYFVAFGGGPDFGIDINVCTDEFIDCELNASNVGFMFISTFYEADAFTGFSGLYGAGGDECRVDLASIPIYGWNDLDGLEVGIYSDAAGAPGVALYSEVFPSGAFPGPPGPLGSQWFDIYPNGGAGIEITGGYHVVMRPIWTPGGLDPWVVIVIDDGSGGVRGHYENGGAWYPSDAVFGAGNSYYTEAFQCCLPFQERVCTAGEDWPTYQHDQQRTGASFNSLGEANCNLNLLWSAQGGPNSFSGSVMFGNKILISDDNGVDCRLLTDGSLVWDQDTDPTVSGLFAGALGNRTQPTVAANTALGIEMTYLGTGLNRDVVGVDANTGAYVWHNTTNAPFAGLAPNAQNIKSVVLNDGAIEVLYYATQVKLYAVDAATGAPYGPWGTNPVVMVADNVNALTTDNAGSQIVAPVYSGAIAGDIYSRSAADGTEVWTLSTLTGAVGLQAEVDALDGYIGNEGFFSGASYDMVNDVFWCNSYLDADHPEEAYLYRIAGSGASYSTAKATRSQRSTPTIDENQIYVPAFTKWATPTISGEQIFSRATGNFVQNMEGHIAGDRQFGDGVLSCETAADDYWIHGTENGELNFYQVGLINELQFYRNTSLTGFNGGQWNSGSMAPDVVAFTTFGGLTVAFGPGLDRPRLSIPPTRQDLPVPFGSPVGHNAVFPGVIGNTGCTDLTISSITFTDPTPPSGTPIEFSAVDAGLRAKMDERATFTTDSRLFEKFGVMYGEAPVGLGPFDTYKASTVGSSLNYRAAVLPDVVDAASGVNGLISPSAGATIAPGAAADLIVGINGPLVTRGPHDFTAHIDTDDPDYVMDDPLAIPTLALRVIGGCLEDSVTLTFGMGGANSLLVFNDAKIQEYNSDGNNSWDIDGFGTGGQYFGGMRGWSLTPHRMAWTGPGWSFNGGWQTILADPNYCGNTCTPTVQPNVLLGAISTDNGGSYDDVFGDIVALSYIDSARDYTGGGGAWDWESNPDPFLPDSTIGMFANETHYGAHDVLGLANLAIIRIDVTNRSLVNSIDDLQHFSYHDQDFAGTSNHANGGDSFGYMFGEGTGPDLFGYGAVGYGCDVAPASRVRAAVGDQFLYTTDIDPGGPFDSIYVWARDPAFAGTTGQLGWELGDPQAGVSDGQSYFGHGGVSLAPGETKSMGIFQFAFSVDSDPAVYDQDPLNPGQFEGMAALANKWAGFGRGDVNDDGAIDLADVVYLAGTAGGGDGAYPFAHLGDVNNDGAVDAADVAYLKDYYFSCGPCPVNDWSLGLCSN